MMVKKTKFTPKNYKKKGKIGGKRPLIFSTRLRRAKKPSI